MLSINVINGMPFFISFSTNPGPIQIVNRYIANTIKSIPNGNSHHNSLKGVIIGQMLANLKIIDEKKTAYQSFKSVVFCFNFLIVRFDLFIYWISNPLALDCFLLYLYIWDKLSSWNFNLIVLAFSRRFNAFYYLSSF